MKTQIVTVPHFGGSQIGYRMPEPIDTKKPVLVMVNSFSTSSDLFTPQFEDSSLAATAQMIAIELYGHGATRSPSEQRLTCELHLSVTP